MRAVRVNKGFGFSFKVLSSGFSEEDFESMVKAYRRGGVQGDAPRKEPGIGGIPSRRFLCDTATVGITPSPRHLLVACFC